MCREPRGHSPPEEKVEGQQGEQGQEIQPEVSFPEEERLVAGTVVVATAAAVIAQRLGSLEGSVWVQDEVQIHGFTPQHDTCSFRFEALHRCND